MTLSLPILRPIHLLFALVLAAFAAVLIAQVEGERGIAPLASHGDFEVKDIKVDVSGPNPDGARATGWRLAQRLAWQSLWKRTNGGTGPALSDGVLDGLVSGIEVQQEQIGPNRYIATLGVMFDRARAGQALGVSGQVRRSPPLLVIPVLWDNGTPITFERPNAWQKSWAEFRTSDSSIDYVRTAGDGPDSLLLNSGQINRRGRNWWRVLLDLYGAADVIMPIARLERSWPGGPITAHFTARYGPDNNYVGDFSLRAASPAELPAMMNAAVERIDALYARALADGSLRTDPTLVIEEPINVVEIENVSDLGAILGVLPSETSSVGAGFSVMVETPTTASVSDAQAAIRAIPGVSGASTSSLALGGTSVMQVSFGGTAEQLRTQLEARGFSVSISGSTLRITRRAAAAPPSAEGGGARP